MAKLYFITKYTTIWVLNLLITPLAQVTQQVVKQPPEFMFYVFVSLLFVPEIALVFSAGLRQWLKVGIEDGDGVLNTKDVQNLVLFYSGLWMLRVFVLSYLFKQFYNIETEFMFTVLPFLGSMGTAGLAIARAILTKRYDFNNK